jgi:hypothetical protein
MCDAHLNAGAAAAAAAAAAARSTPLSRFTIRHAQSKYKTEISFIFHSKS